MTNVMERELGKMHIGGAPMKKGHTHNCGDIMLHFFSDAVRACANTPQGICLNTSQPLSFF